MLSMSKSLAPTMVRLLKLSLCASFVHSHITKPSVKALAKRVLRQSHYLRCLVDIFGGGQSTGVLTIAASAVLPPKRGFPYAPASSVHPLREEGGDGDQSNTVMSIWAYTLGQHYAVGRVTLKQTVG
jgi:hypothetical protein